VKRLTSFLRWVGFLIFVVHPIATTVFASKARAQVTEVVPAVRFGVVSPDVRDYLAAEWDHHLNDDPYLERGYCGYLELRIWAGEPAFVVTSITRPDTVVGIPGTTHIDFRCFSPKAVPIHVHPPRNCPTREGPCTRDGPYAYQCLPSAADRESLVLFEFPFGVIQCERKALRTFWPTGIAGN
jgi:hypothetical protein